MGNVVALIVNPVKQASPRQEIAVKVCCLHANVVAPGAAMFATLHSTRKMTWPDATGIMTIPTDFPEAPRVAYVFDPVSRFGRLPRHRAAI